MADKYTFPKRSVPIEDEFLFELQVWALSFAPSILVGDLEPYDQARVAGVVQRLCINPVSGTIEALITDGTGQTWARWSLRRPTSQLGLAPGRGVLLEGPTSIAPDGTVAFEDPWFDILETAPGRAERA